jgi:hypothetical protein
MCIYPVSGVKFSEVGYSGVVNKRGEGTADVFMYKEKYPRIKMLW